MRPPPHVDAQRPPRERGLEDALSEVAGEEQAVRPTPAEGGEQAQFGDADVLGLVDDAEVERRMRRLGNLRGQPREHGGLRQPPVFRERRPDPREDRPEHLALLLGEPRPAAEPRQVAVGFPGLELPGVDHRAPLRPQEVRAEPVALDAGRGTVEQGPDVLVAGEIEGAGAGRVEPPADAAHGVHLEALGDLRLVADQTREPHAQGGGQRVGERRQQHAALGVRAGEMHGPVEGHDGLAGAGRPRDAGGAVVLALDELALGRMQEDRPLLPGIVQGPLERLHVGHHPEPPLGVGVGERIGVDLGRHGQGESSRARGQRRPHDGRRQGGSPPVASCSRASAASAGR